MPSVFPSKQLILAALSTYLVPSLLDAVLIAHSCLSNLNYGYRRTGMLVCVPCVRFQAAGGGGGQARVSGF